MFGLRYELIFLKNRTNKNSEIIAMTIATLTPTSGVNAPSTAPPTPSNVLIVLSTNKAYVTTAINHPNVN